MLPDVQALPDTRGITLDDAGIEGLRYPILVPDGQGGKRETVAVVGMSVSVDAAVKGAHLSRFVEVLHEWREQLAASTIAEMTSDLRNRMGSQTASVSLRFPYFLERCAPVSGLVSLMDYTCGLSATATATGTTLQMHVAVPVSSVCPCSKAISDRGAHNQRGTISIDVALSNADAELWFDALIDIAESAGSSPVYALLKRVDERHVTMAGYDNPVFVEDMARHVVEQLRQLPEISALKVRVVNDESIHNHAAFAQLSQTLTPHTTGGSR